jgi:glycosyltransferase involved in cell wall biosynthesis
VAPELSVLLPVRDGARWLREAIDSVLSQTLGDLELIVVDDGSEDSTPTIIAAYEDHRLVRLRNPRPLGLSASLNRALGRARGSLIARQDADDISLPRRLERQAAYLEENPVVGLLGTAYWSLDEAGLRAGPYRQPANDQEIRWQMLFHNAFCHSSVVFRREVAGSGESLYAEGLSASQDYDAWSRLLERTRGANLEEPLVVWRKHGASTSGRLHATQQAIANGVSARQLRALLGRELCEHEVAALRGWFYAPQVLATGAFRPELIFEIAVKFSADPRVDPSTARRVRDRAARAVWRHVPPRRAATLALRHPWSLRALAGLAQGKLRRLAHRSA